MSQPAVEIPERKYCTLVQLAIERNEQDLENGHLRGLYYNEVKADKAVKFFGLLKHSKGSWAGQKFKLEYSQEFHRIRPVFGWYKPDFEWNESKPFDWDRYPPDQFPKKWVRRFNEAYVQLPKKTGKSTEAAGIGALLLYEGEPAAEIYSAAAKKEQAKLVHEEAKRMIRSSPSLMKRAEIVRDNICIPNTYSSWNVFSKGARGSDGINPHGAIVDELHQWPWSEKELLNIILESGITRDNPLVYIITTAGDSKTSLCYTKRVYAEKVLRGIYQDDSFFAYVCEPTDEELEVLGWDNPELWELINPGWNITIKPRKVKQACQSAKIDPVKKTAFLRYRLNLWVADQELKMLNFDRWQHPRASYIRNRLKGETCYLGVDLSSTIDLTALMAVFPELPGGFLGLLAWFWVPGDNVIDRVERDNVPYNIWIDQGFIIPTAGNAVDYNALRNQINECVEEFDVKQICVDPWNVGKLGQELQDEDGHELAQVRQGYPSLNDPCKFLQAQTLGRTIQHNSNPVLDWCASNIVVRMDPNGNIAPNKEKSEEKIDGITATLTALNRVLLDLGDDDEYPERGLVTTRKDA